MPKYRKQKHQYDIMPDIYTPESKQLPEKSYKDIEIVTDAGMLTYDELERQILDGIHTFYRGLYGNDVTDRYIIEKSKNNTWRGCMTYLHDHVISKINLNAPVGSDEVPSRGGAALSLDTMETLARIYNHICNIYNKPQSIMAYSHLCGVSYMVMELWGHSEMTDKVSRRRRGIYKIVIGERIESITTRLFDSGAAPIGTIAVYNTEVLPGGTGQDSGYTAAESLPKLK